MTNNRYKLLQVNFDVNTFIYCLGTNLVHSFFLLKKLKRIILFS